MNRITFAATVLTVLGLAAPASAQNLDGVRPLPSITVSGQADVDHSPDQATVTFTIVTNSENAGRATSANNLAYEALAAKLAGLGLSASQIKTTSYDVNFIPRPPSPNPQSTERYGYTVSRIIDATTSRTSNVGPMIDAAAGSGALVGNVRFGIRDTTAAYNQALAAAVVNADGQAHALAVAAHVRIVRILSIAAGSSNQGPRPVQPMFARAAMSLPSPTDVPPSDLTVHAAVTVRYEIAP